MIELLNQNLLMPVFAIAVLIMSAVIHEISHGYAAKSLGDPTAELAGRLTLNPVKHLDPFMSVILPLLFIVFQSPVILGGAKPVPYNPYNLRGGKWGPAWVAFAGPLANFVLAIIFTLAVRSGLVEGPTVDILALIILINLVLGFFNLIPIPPLDGSKVIAALLPYTLYRQWQQFESLMSAYGLFVVFAFIFIFSAPFFAFVLWVFSLLVG